jgi:hypothetical protein
VPCRYFWPLHEAWTEVVGGRRGRVTEDWASSSLTSRWDGRPGTQGLGLVMHAGRDRPPDLGETKASGFRKPMLLWSSRPATARPAWRPSYRDLQGSAGLTAPANRDTHERKCSLGRIRIDARQSLA